MCSDEAEAAEPTAGLPLVKAWSRRAFLRDTILSLLASGFSTPLLVSPPAPRANMLQRALGYRIEDIIAQSGIHFEQVCGGATSKRYILETTGSGVAFIDYDNDGWPDIFFVNGSSFDEAGMAANQGNRLFHNNRDGTFTDVTAQAGLTRKGWGQGVCIGDYDNDGYEDLYVTYWGENVLYHNNGDGTFTDVTHHAGVGGQPGRWSTGCAFVDYDRDGHLDLFVTHYIDFSLATAKDPGSNPYCTYRNLPVNCGPRGLKGESNTLYRNNGDGTFEDVSRRSAVGAVGNCFGLGVLTGDFDNDGWPDIYVASDSTPSLLFMNKTNGTFSEEGTLRGVAFSEEGREQAGMGVSAGDYDNDGWLDILKTNFSDETPDLYKNTGKAVFNDVSSSASLDQRTHYVGWGCGFFDPDNDGLLDVFYCNGHVYPELAHASTDTAYLEPRVLYRNRGDGTFEDVSELAGAMITRNSTGRGCAFADFNNDGVVDIVINNQNAGPSLLRFHRENENHWINIKLEGVKSNRSAIGARVLVKTGSVTQLDEVRSGGSYLSQNDLRLHFGLAQHRAIDSLQVRWPSGAIDSFKDLKADTWVHIREGGKLSVLRSA